MVPEKNFRKRGKQRSGPVEKLGNRQINKRENRQIERQKAVQTDGGCLIRPSLRGPNNSITRSFLFVSGS